MNCSECKDTGWIEADVGQVLKYKCVKNVLYVNQMKKRITKLVNLQMYQNTNTINLYMWSKANA